MHKVSPQRLVCTGALLFLHICITVAQELPKNWHLLDQKKDNVAGISIKKAFKLLESNDKVAKPVIVAVLDSGVDIKHEDLTSVIWTNTKEVANNGKDDDNNGYVDDINGWNFIGNPKGESLISETLEITRIYRNYKQKFANKDKFTISTDQKKEYLYYLSLRKEYEDAYTKLNSRLSEVEEEYTFFNQLVPPLQKAMKKDVFSADELTSFKPKNQEQQKLKVTFLNILSRNKGLTSEKLIEHYDETKENKEEIQTRLNHNYNIDFDGRKLIGDNNNDLSEKVYGNADVTKRSGHGTHVSGIIGAIRENKLGINGIATQVVIMPIRTTPMGDETDKDVANGIRYAVDNGAKIINMSFGKSYSPHKLIVDKAIKYAEEKGVLLIHGSGNEHTNTDLYYNYPSALMEDGSIASNWIEVGASAAYIDERLAASFSNYGKKSVDIFAPGVDIYSTLPDQKYGTRSGTSMAAPVVTGVAALLLSYFPALTPEQVKEIILESGTLHSINVKIPGQEETIPFAELSKTGKVINAYNAVKLALEKEN